MSLRPAPSIAWKSFSNSPHRASARLRSFLPCRYLREAGWRCEMFDPKKVGSYELVIFQKAYDEESILLARSLRNRGVKTVFDLSDNHFFNPDDAPALRERADRLRRMIIAVDAVSVSTPELGKLIERGDCVVIDDVLEMPRRNALLSALSRVKERLPNISSARPLRVVWYGNAGAENPPFGLIDLPRVLPHLEALNAQTSVALTVISNSAKLFRKYVGKVSFPVRYHEWRQDTFPRIFGRQDICIIPVTPNPFTRCKTNNRVALSLIMGVPVIADEIPSYEEFRDFILFSDWTNSLQAYAADRELRRQHVRRAQRYIRSKYNKERVVSQWSALFERMLGRGRGRA
jgi:hypothetical protein